METYSLKNRRVRRIITVQLIFVLIALFANGGILSVHDPDSNNNLNFNVNGTTTASATNTNNYDAPSYCDHEGSLHQIALDMFHHSSPPGSASYNKLKHVLGLSEFFYTSLGAPIFSKNEHMLKKMLEGMGLVHVDMKSLGGMVGKTEVILVETYKTQSSCPLVPPKPDCHDQPRIFIQTEQKINWHYQKYCHASPNCVILEFSDFNRNKFEEEGMHESIVLLPVMTQTPSRISQFLPEVPKIIQERNIDMVFFGLITNRRTGLSKAAVEHGKTHPNSNVIVTNAFELRHISKSYQEAKVCLLMHSYTSHCGGEYHRMSEFGPFGCIPVMEKFADTVGIHAYEKCGGAIFTNSTHVIPTAAGVVEQIDKGLYNNRSQDIINWWKKGIRWETILPTVYPVPS